jgi:cytochrome d ubiquinol oxidase subunit I
VSPGVSSGFVLTTLVLFTLLYGVLGVICFRMVRRIAVAGPDPAASPPSTGPVDAPQLSLV